MSEHIKKDLVIVGGGPAGLTATIYASRALLDSVTLEQEAFGGQMVKTAEVDNYPGVPHTDGFTLSDLMRQQAIDLGAEVKLGQIKSLHKDDASNTFVVETADGTYDAKSVIVAGGATPRKAGFEGEIEYGGHGVSYCATCDGMFYRNKEVFVIGGGNSACEEAIFLTRFASKVTLVVRKDHVRAQASVAKELEENEKIEVRYLTSITKVDGNGNQLTSITFRNNETGEEHEETFDAGSFGIFVFVGLNPQTSLIEGMVELNAGGYVVADARMATKTPGLFVAGDLVEKPLRQIVTAAADGAIAATSAAGYLGQPIDG